MRGAALLVLLAGCGDEPLAPGTDLAISGDTDANIDSDGAPGSGDDGGNASRCTETTDSISCPMIHQMVISRDVYYQQPLGTPPVNGWSVVILFQGSLFSPAVTMQASTSEPFGAYYQVLTVKRLLDAGYVVLAPAAHGGGSTFWDTNVPPWDVAWSGAPDDQFMQAIFAAMAAGVFGPLDGAHQYATGISSGGYMTSRMAVSYAGRFRALAIASGSYATCSGAVCNVPTPLPSDHPPTLFLHGDADPVVPVSTMKLYRDELSAEGHVTDSIIEAGAGHQWIAPAPDAVLQWFDTYR
jgi:dienelactone hydrolase